MPVTFRYVVKISLLCILFFPFFSTLVSGHQTPLIFISSQISALPEGTVSLEEKLKWLQKEKTSVSNSAGLEQELRKTLLEQLDSAILNLESAIKTRRYEEELQKEISPGTGSS